MYSPTGDNTTRDSLNYSEVVAMTSDLLNEKATLRQVLLTRYPILFIDESQDTSARLMDAMLGVQTSNPGDFCLGLFGDMMQRIYADRKGRPRQQHSSRVGVPRKANQLQVPVTRHNPHQPHTIRCRRAPPSSKSRRPHWHSPPLYCPQEHAR